MKLLTQCSEEKRNWWWNHHNLAAVVLYVTADCRSVTETRQVTAEILGEPWKWRAEYCVARCRQLDGRSYGCG